MAEQKPPPEHRYQRPTGREPGYSDPLCRKCGWPRRSEAHIQHGDVEEKEKV